MKKWIAYVLIVVGLLIVVYPVGAQWYDNRIQEKMLEEWEQELLEESAELTAQDQFNTLTALFDSEPGNSEVEAAVETSPEPDPEPSKEPEKEALPDPIATIKIPSINLSLPVLEGATQKNMKYAAAHLTETGKFGQIGNAAIAAHRMKTKGRLFNRLNEVAEGDSIKVTAGGKTFDYTVYKVSIVEPTDVSVLNYNKIDKLLTLITCDPVVNPTHRLIVHAKISE